MAKSRVASEEISIREFAKRMEIGYSTARRAVQRGRISSKGKGRNLKLKWPAARSEFLKNREVPKVREKDEEKVGLDRFGRQVNGRPFEEKCNAFNRRFFLFYSLLKCGNVTGRKIQLGLQLSKRVGLIPAIERE